MNADDREKAQTLYATTCKGCHGDNMQGAGIAPSLVNVGQRVSFEDFKKILEVGKGQMPGFAHVEEGRVTAIYRYLGGNPGRGFGGPGGFGARGGAQAKPVTGPVVANGGATIKADEKSTPSMTDYPVPHANKDRYTTGYGTEFPNMLGPVWSRVLAYDLNKGVIKWDKPLGVDALAESKGLKNTGSPSGGIRRGMVVTSTGLIFAIGKGGKLTAYDAANGNVVWDTNLSWESNAQPIMYEVNGKQYLAVSATGNFSRENTDRSKDPGALPRGYVVYSLPDKK
jgi:quinoprotein glucose dehydrogenase